MHDIEELLELEGSPAGQNRHKLLRNQIRDPARECVFLQNGHKGQTITYCLFPQ